MSKTLFELSDEMLQLQEAMEVLGEDDQAISAVVGGYLSRLQGDLKNKLDGYAALIRELESRAELRKTEGNRLLHRSKVDANQAMRLKESLSWFFQTHSIKSLETPHYRLSLVANGQAPVQVTAPAEELPSEYVQEVITQRIDLQAIRTALENGLEVPGAALGERKLGIRIF